MGKEEPRSISGGVQDIQPSLKPRAAGAGWLPQRLGGGTPKTLPGHPLRPQARADVGEPQTTPLVWRSRVGWFRCCLKSRSCSCLFAMVSGIRLFISSPCTAAVAQKATLVSIFWGGPSEMAGCWFLWLIPTETGIYLYKKKLNEQEKPGVPSKRDMDQVSPGGTSSPRITFGCETLTP